MNYFDLYSSYPDRTVAEIVTRALFGLVLLAVLVGLLTAPASGGVIYVSSNAQLSNGDGSRARPYRRITDALAHVRRLSGDGSDETFVVDVAAGTYVGAYTPTLLAAHPEWEHL